MEAFGWERMLKLHSWTPPASLFVATFLATNLLVLQLQSLTPPASLFVATFLATNLLVLRILVYTLLWKSNESEVGRITS